MKTLISTIALGLATTVAVPASATSFTVDFTGTSAASGTGRIFTATTGSESLSVKATAWWTNGATVRDSTLGVYGGSAGGLGATNDFEDGSYNTHTIDNHYGTDFILLQFDQAVKLTSAYLNVYSVYNTTADSDMTLGWGGTNTGMGALALNNTSYSTVSGMLSNTSNAYAATGANGTSGWRNISLGAAAGTLWMVSASQANPDGYIDGFKLRSIMVDSAVPEPATWAMMLVGFGMIGAASRYQRRRTVAAIA